MSSTHPSCDASAALGRPPTQPKVARPGLVLATTILASSLAFVDGSVVNVGLPAIGRSLHSAPDALQWVVNAYLLPLSALLLFGGAMGDRFGRRRLLVWGTALFALASLACTFAPGIGWLLAGRVVQGVAAAMLMPNSLAILGDSFSGEAKGRAVGTWAAVGAIAGAIGPVIGGALIDTVGWRAIFLINLPIAAGAIALALWSVHEPKTEQHAPLDLVGAGLATLGLAGLTWGLTEGSGPRGWTTLPIAGVIVGAAFLALFAWAEARQGERAMAPLSLFGSRTFVGLTLLTLALYGALGALMILVPFVLIQASGYSGTAAGAALLPFPLILAATSPLMGSLAGRIGPRLPLTIGPLIVAGGFLLLLRVDARGGYWTEVLPAILVIAIGMAGAVAPLTSAVLSSVDHAHTGSASGFNSAMARIGGLIATALLGPLFAARGQGLIDALHVAAMVSAVAALAASASALLIARGRSNAT